MAHRKPYRLAWSGFVCEGGQLKDGRDLVLGDRLVEGLRCAALGGGDQDGRHVHFDQLRQDGMQRRAAAANLSGERNERCVDYALYALSSALGV